MRTLLHGNSHLEDGNVPFKHVCWFVGLFGFNGPLHLCALQSNVFLFHYFDYGLRASRSVVLLLYLLRGFDLPSLSHA